MGYNLDMRSCPKKSEHLFIPPSSRNKQSYTTLLKKRNRKDVRKDSLQESSCRETHWTSKNTLKKNPRISHSAQYLLRSPQLSPGFTTFVTTLPLKKEEKGVKQHCSWRKNIRRDQSCETSHIVNGDYGLRSTKRSKKKNLRESLCKPVLQSRVDLFE